MQEATALKRLERRHHSDRGAAGFTRAPIKRKEQLKSPPILILDHVIIGEYSHLGHSRRSPLTVTPITGPQATRSPL